MMVTYAILTENPRLYELTSYVTWEHFWYKIRDMFQNLVGSSWDLFSGAFR